MKLFETPASLRHRNPSSHVEFSEEKMNIKTVITIVSGIYLSDCISFFIHQDEVQCMHQEHKIQSADDLLGYIEELIKGFDTSHVPNKESDSCSVPTMTKQTKKKLLSKMRKTAVQELLQKLTGLCNDVDAMVEVRIQG
jgi:hypothetical protein